MNKFRHNLVCKRYQLKKSLALQTKKRAETEKRLNKLMLDKAVYYNNKIASIENKIAQVNFLLNEL